MDSSHVVIHRNVFQGNGDRVMGSLGGIWLLERGFGGYYPWVCVGDGEEGSCVHNIGDI